MYHTEELGIKIKAARRALPMCNGCWVTVAGRGRSASEYIKLSTCCAHPALRGDLRSRRASLAMEDPASKTYQTKTSSTCSAQTDMYGAAHEIDNHAQDEDPDKGRDA